MDFKIIHIDETDSTNKWLKAFGRGKMVVVAEYQTAGKGCGSNSWESEREMNLTFSILIHPETVLARDQFRITEWVSVALCSTLQHYIYNKVEIKWPNDIYVDDRKICGILIENRLQGTVIKDSIIGIGLNVNQTKFTSDAPNPVSLKQLTGKDVEREVLLDDFLQAFNKIMVSETVAQEYRNRLYRRVGTYEFEDGNGRFKAEMVRVETDGRLVLADKTGHERTYTFKEVKFII